MRSPHLNVKPGQWIASAGRENFAVPTTIQDEGTLNHERYTRLGTRKQD